MKTVLAVIASLALLSSAALAQERAGSAALGALSGAVVLGPVGAVAGAVVGYTAGPSIARSWGLRHSKPQRRSSKRSHRQRTTANDSRRAPGAQTASRNATSTAAMAAEPRAAPPKLSMPPVQALDY